jgi:hypothetical protein
MRPPLLRQLSQLIENNKTVTTFPGVMIKYMSMVMVQQATTCVYRHLISFSVSDQVKVNCPNDRSHIPGGKHDRGIVE